jgi:hypothetical protein
MAIEGATGQSTTVAFADIGTIACVRSISLPEFSIESIDASCIAPSAPALPNRPPIDDDGLSPTQDLNDIIAEYSKKIPGQLVEAGEIQITMVFALTDHPHIPNGLVDTITITLPNAGTTGGILTGTGFISSCQMPSIELNGLLEQTITFVFDGNTGPTYTKGTA